MQKIDKNKLFLILSVVQSISFWMSYILILNQSFGIMIGILGLFGGLWFFVYFLIILRQFVLLFVYIFKKDIKWKDSVFYIVVSVIFIFISYKPFVASMSV